MANSKLKTLHTKNILSFESRNLLDFLHIKSHLRKLSEERISRKIKLGGENTVSPEDFIGEKNILVFPNIPWGYRKQRPQQIFSRLAKLGYNIFYISPIVSTSESIVQIEESVYQVNLASDLSYNILRDIDIVKSQSDAISASVQKLFDVRFLSTATVFVLHPVWINVVKSISIITKPNKIVYDLMDLYSGFPEAEPSLVDAELDFLSQADTVTTTAESLFIEAKKYNKNVILVPNGCDYDYFSNIKPNGILDSLTDRQIIGYFGAVNDWFDVELIRKACIANPERWFVIIGSINSKCTRSLYCVKNLLLIGEIAYDDIGGYLAYFDVCLIPFILNELIKSTNPVKFYEYLATGKPIVSTMLPELNKYKDVCYLAETHDDFLEKIDKAVNESANMDIRLTARRKEIAKQSSWDNRVEQILIII